MHQKKMAARALVNVAACIRPRAQAARKNELVPLSGGVDEKGRRRRRRRRRRRTTTTRRRDTENEDAEGDKEDEDAAEND